MITRENIGELAAFESPQACALSFYYQPATPQNKSHREEVILVKDLVRDALREAEKRGRNGCARSDLERIMELAERLHGNGGRAKAVFACGGQHFWREYDVPPRLPASKLFVSRHFRLRPLTALSDVLPHVCIALADRSKARLFELWMDEISERESFTDELPRRGRSDGFGGFNAGHAERKVENEAARHFQKLADRLKELQEQGKVDRLILGCREENWSEVERTLHTYSKQKLIGRFAADPATYTLEQVRTEAERILEQYRSNRWQGLVQEVVGEAHRNARGALGLRRVLRSLETGEVQTLLLGRNFSAPASECKNCHHIDPHVRNSCEVCGGEAVVLEDVTDVLLRLAVQSKIEIVHIPEHPEFAKVGDVAALLRFRADQNTPMKQAV
jgi:peptide subunit release factor 1 (eRF1)